MCHEKVLNKQQKGEKWKENLWECNNIGKLQLVSFISKVEFLKPKKKIKV